MDPYQRSLVQNKSPLSMRNYTKLLKKSEPGIYLTKTEYETFQQFSNSSLNQESFLTSWTGSENLSEIKKIRHRSRNSSKAFSMDLTSNITPEILKITIILRMALKGFNPNSHKQDRRRFSYIEISESLDNGYRSPSFSIWKSQIEQVFRLNNDYHKGPHQEKSYYYVVESNIIGVAANYIS